MCPAAGQGPDCSRLARKNEVRCHSHHRGRLANQHDTPTPSLILFWDKVCHWDWRFTEALARKLHWSSYLFLPGTGIMNIYLHTWFLRRRWDSNSGPHACLHTRCFTNWAVSPALSMMPFESVHFSTFLEYLPVAGTVLDLETMKWKHKVCMSWWSWITSGKNRNVHAWWAYTDLGYFKDQKEETVAYRDALVYLPEKVPLLYADGHTLQAQGVSVVQLIFYFSCMCIMYHDI